MGHVDEASGRAIGVKTALVIGATGGIGGEMTRTLLRRGWRVTALHRAPGNVRDKLPGIDWIAGDAMQPEDVKRAAHGARLIVHAANPPGYRDWDRLARPMLRNAMAAATANDARLLFPGAVYNFGIAALPLVGEDAPQQPRTRKGRIRVEMEEMLRDGARHGLRSLVVRAGDFFGPQPGNNWFSQCLVKPGRSVTRVTYPGPAGIGHSWAYLPDLAETMMQLVERDAELAAFDVFHFAGHWLPDGSAMTDAIRAATGNPAIAQRSLFWPAIYAAAPFVTLCREMLEMRYLWQRDLRLDNGKLLRLLGREPHTDLTEAVRRTLTGLGCLSSDLPSNMTAPTTPVAS
ncbi:MAG TPA: NAD(P)H-binding protein [Dongiaceae bacterium]|nr:NAD(P)H-binding protein [Dongiaceae bacterium]